MDYKAYALVAILLTSVAIAGISNTTITAFAQTNSITAETDKTQYQTGDTITVTGEVGTVRAGQPVLIQVFNPNGAAYRFDQAPVTNGTYSYQFVVGGQLGITGEYTVRATYDRASQEATFSFTSAGQQAPQMNTYALEVDGQTIPIRYSISGGQLNSITTDFNATTLTANITSTDDGVLTLELPRNVIDSKEGDADSEFAVFIDGQGDMANETSKNNNSRTLAIEFENGAEQIEIVGTSIIPEFGPIAAIILAISLVAMVIAATRYSGRFRLV